MLWAKCEETLFDKLFDIWLYCLIIVAELFLLLALLAPFFCFIFCQTEWNTVDIIFIVFIATMSFLLEIGVVAVTILTIIETYKKIKEVV